MNPAYRPMLATLVDEPFDDKEWVFETKWDGFRLITEKRDQTVRLWSRMALTSPQGTVCFCRRFKRSRARAS
jgi:ATP-dependent DNA ligase